MSVPGDRLGRLPPVHHQDQESSARPHINPRFSHQTQTASHHNKVPNVHINPNFSYDHAGPGKVLLNPKFNTSPPVSPPKPQGVHYNPKFSSRPLPAVPRPPKPARLSLQRPQQQLEGENIYASLRKPDLKLDQNKKSQFEDSIKRTVMESNNKVLVNPNFAPPLLPTPSKPSRPSLQATCSTTGVPQATEKENLPGSTVKSNKMNLFTPIRKSAAFKKIGSRKLVRVKRKSGGPVTPNSVPNASFKKIGSKKLIRIVSSTKERPEDSVASPGDYKVKTKTKIVKSVKNTPSNTSKYRFSFITPLSMRKNKVTRNSGSKKSFSSGKKKLSAFRSRFKLDRRSKGKQEPKVLFKSTSQTKIKKLSGSTYRVSSTKLQKVATTPSKQTTTSRAAKYRAKPKVVNPSIASNKVITVQGVKFSVAENGRKLKRLASTSSLTPQATTPLTGYSASVSQTGSPGQISSSSPHQEATSLKPSPNMRPRAGSQGAHPKVYLGGEEFDEVEPGVFTRSRHSLTRQSITNAKNRSINIIMKNQSRSKQFCMFFNKFGKCTKKEKGSCPYLHDPDKVAVCRRFLQGACVKDKCLLSHKVAPEKMPACKFFLEGLCSKDPCPYLHVKVSEQAEICENFLKGYCANGSDCRQRHVMACPQFDRDGICKLVGKCPFPHVNRAQVETEKKVPPVKPKRKSLGLTPGDHSKKSRVTARYYHEQEKVQTEGREEEQDTASESLEEKRKRLLRKIELAKQGWTGVTVTEQSRSNSVSSSSETRGRDGGSNSVSSSGETRGREGGSNSVSSSGETRGREGGLDDSGPYEKIDSGSESETERVGRPPIGQLGDFISLAGYSSEEEENCTEHRLI